MLIVDSSFFNIFNISFILGNANQALSSINNVVLTESSAKRIFGTVNVVGKTILLNHQSEMLVTGVVKDLPENLSFKAEIFVSFANSPEQRLFYKMSSSNNEDSFPCNIFVELYKNVNVNTIGEMISSFNILDNFLYPKKVILTPLESNYFNTDYNDADLLHGNTDLMKLLTVIGVFILLLAVINFINLTTASYKHRLKEFGVKKCLGADRLSLIKQLLTESFLLTIMSAVFGILIAEIFLPYFNQFINQSLPLLIFNDFRFLILFIAFILLLSLIIGILPSLILSKISPLQLFKRTLSLKGSEKNYRNIFTTFQFSIAIILITGSIIILEQIDFVKHRSPGFNTEHLLYLKVHYTQGNNIQVLADKLEQYHGTKSLTKTFGIPGEILLTSGGFSTIAIDSTALKTFGFNIIKGRNLLPGDADRAVLINQTAFNQLKTKDGGDMKLMGCNVVGVVSDFQYSPLYTKIGPLALWYNTGITPNTITMRITGPVSQAVKYIREVWTEVCPDYPLNFGFYNDYFASMYQKEENLASLVSIFSILAVVISCLGIFGLAVFQSEQRIKEIGIRKVLGASVTEIIFLLTKSFTKWVIFANILAVPVSYYLLNKWLQNFAYRIEISWWIFVLAGSTALLIALTTISVQAVKAAIANPVESLRYE